MFSGAHVDRYDFGKLIAGGCLSIVFTAMVFGPMGFGRRYVDQLEQKVRLALDDRELSKVSVAIQHDPALRRVVILSGTVAARDRESAMRISGDVPGVAQVRWNAGSPSTGDFLRDPRAEHR
jgi:hypothetical protein